MRDFLLCYGAVSGALFIVGVVIGKIFKRDVLHGGVVLGFVNSFLLSLAWPVTVGCIVSGWVFDLYQEWKRL